MRREHLKRHAADADKAPREAEHQKDDSNVVVVKTAQSA